MIEIKKGLDVPISGIVNQQIEPAKSSRSYALVGSDYIDMKPTMLVKEGDVVKRGQKLFSCKRTTGVFYTAPAGGKVVAIHRGERRSFQSLVIEGSEKEESVDFSEFVVNDVSEFSREKVLAGLVDSGLWTSFRTRPFSKVPSPESTCHSIFVTAMDTHPLALDPQIVIDLHKDDFEKGLRALTELTDHKVYVCSESSLNIKKMSQVEERYFQGKHPAGNVGTHMHFVSPVHMGKIHWHLSYQDVIAIGHFFTTGDLNPLRYIALGGPQVKNPRVLKTRMGANLLEILDGELEEGNNRIVSGSVLHGDKVTEGALAYLRRYSTQVTVIEEGTHREFLGWHSPGLDKFSLKNIYLSKLFPHKRFDMTSDRQGSHRALVPIGSYEKVIPLRLLPTPLLRSLLTRDSDEAQSLGCLELDEEDLALCTFVCPSKIDYGPLLRETLSTIEKEG